MSKPSKLLQGLVIALTAVSWVAMAPAVRAEEVATPKQHVVAKHKHHFVGTRARYGYHPTASGGTTGGTVNPGVNGDHRSHGYNGS